jgi:ABC-type nitrate/sulfonate/bicarbonate transport system substrate-binding protein
MIRPREIGTALAVAVLLAVPSWPRAEDVVRLSQTISTDAQVADEKGFFKAHGIRIQWTGKQAHGPAVLVTVAAGENDFAGTVTSAVFLARARGSKLKVVSAQTVSSRKVPLFRYLVKDNGPLRGDAKDFIGRKVVAQPATITWYPLAVFLKRGGVDPSEVEFVNLGSPLASEQALKEGKVDAISTSEFAPPGSKLTAEGGYHYLAGIDDFDVLGVKQIGGWATREDFIRDHPDVVRRFVAALSEAAVWGNAHPVEAQEILDRLNEVPRDQWKYYRWRPVEGDLKVDPKSIEGWARILEDFGQIPVGSVHPEDVYTNAFADAVSKGQ